MRKILVHVGTTPRGHGLKLEGTALVLLSKCCGTEFEYDVRYGDDDDDTLIPRCSHCGSRDGMQKLESVFWPLNRRNLDQAVSEALGYLAVDHFEVEVTHPSS